MVVGVFPIAKLGALFLRQVSKPIANFAKERAKHNYFFRTYVCMPPAQFYNWCEVRIKMWVMNMGKPDSIPPLNEQMAIELGANLLGESIVFVVAAGVIVLEYSRQVRKEATKEAMRQEEIDAMNDKIRDLSMCIETHHAQIRRLEHSIAEIDSKTIRIPWKGGSKPPTEDTTQSKPTPETKDTSKCAPADKHDNKVTKDGAATTSANLDGTKKDDEKKR